MTTRRGIGAAGRLIVATGLLLAAGSYFCGTNVDAQTAAPGSVSRSIGVIKAINGSTITLAPDSNSTINVAVSPATRLSRIAPGETNPKNATPMQFEDLKVGDMVRVLGRIADDGKSIVAASIIALKAAEVDARNRQAMEDWQKRGVGGVVTAVAPAAGAVTISVSNFGAKKELAIHTTKATVIRRYAPDSVKFDDAKPGTLGEIHIGDQVRARGDKSADGTQITADEVVSGTFRNIAGTVESADASSSTVSVHDLIAKKSITVKVTQDSQLRQLPPEMAQRLAARLRGMGAGAGSSAPSGATGQPSGGQGAGATPGSGASGENGAPKRPAGDLQQMLGRLPAVPLTDLHKGDAIVILATEGTGGVGSVVTLLTGVEPILRAAPNASGAAILTPWSLGAPSGDAGGGP